jgi:two-component system sensor histidine kinase BaeS
MSSAPKGEGGTCHPEEPQATKDLGPSLRATRSAQDDRPKASISWLASVRTRLTLTILLVVFVSWFLFTTTFLYFAAREARDLERELRQTGHIATRSLPEIIRSHPLVTRTWTVAQSAGEKTVMVLMYPMGRGIVPARLIVALLLAWIGGALLARHITRPLAALAQGAQAFHDGDLAHRVPVRGKDEFAQVATTMNEMADRVAAQLAELHEDAERRRQLLADVAHELRSPVANLRTMLQALQDGVADQPERREQALGSASQAARRLERLVADLLQLARLDLHELPLHLAPVDLRALARERLEAHAEAARQAGQSLLPIADGAPVIIEADRERLAQALDNLLDNAVAYAGRGATLSVEVMERGLSSPRAVVADTGSGIAPEDLPHIFEPFYRAETARTPAHEHSGLGLRIARGLIEAHGGTLTVHSAPGQGTKAIIELADRSNT